MDYQTEITQTEVAKTDLILDIKEVLIAMKESIKMKDNRIKQLEKYEAVLSEVHTELTAMLVSEVLEELAEVEDETGDATQTA